VAEIVCFTSHTFREVLDELTWLDYLDLQAIWKQWPPVAISSAVAAGMSPQQRKTPNDDDLERDAEDNLAALELMLGPAPTLKE
jgi:hypothetical protein